jgi:hypothetical protein
MSIVTIILSPPRGAARRATVAACSRRLLPSPPRLRRQPGPRPSRTAARLGEAFLSERIPMGMFDYVKCEYPLPSNPPCSAWQSKETPAQYLDTYMISADGKLLHEESDPQEKMDTGQSSTGRMIELSDFTGEFEFHDSDAVTGDWWSYTAKFASGKLLSIVQNLFRQPLTKKEE